MQNTLGFINNFGCVRRLQPMDSNLVGSVEKTEDRKESVTVFQVLMKDEHSNIQEIRRTYNCHLIDIHSSKAPGKAEPQMEEYYW